MGFECYFYGGLSLSIRVKVVLGQALDGMLGELFSDGVIKIS